jgi:hypothetical protein
MNGQIYRSGLVNQYEIAKSNRFGYGSVFAPQYRYANSSNGLSEPSGRWGCLVLGTRPEPGTVEETYCVVYYASNKNANAAFPSVPFTESYEYADIASVFNTYIRGVRKGECPEYFPYVNTNGKVSNKTTVDYKAVIKYVADRLPELKKYTSAAAFVATMFYHAGDEYKKNSASIRPDVLWPLTVDSRDQSNPYMNQWFNMREDKLKVDTENSAFSGINDFMSNLLTLVVVGGAIYYFAPIIFSRK